MTLKWGSTTVTAVKWGSTNCTVVYWGSTIVFPDGYIPLSRGYTGIYYYGYGDSSPSGKCLYSGGNITTTYNQGGYTETINNFATISGMTMTSKYRMRDGGSGNIDVKFWSGVCALTSTNTINLTAGNHTATLNWSITRPSGSYNYYDRIGIRIYYRTSLPTTGTSVSYGSQWYTTASSATATNPISATKNITSARNYYITIEFTPYQKQSGWTSIPQGTIYTHGIFTINSLVIV